MRPVRSDAGASLHWRVRAVFGVAVAIAVLAAALGAASFGALLDARRQLVDRVDPALASSERLLAAMVDQETGVRAYVLSNGDDRFLEPYRRGVVSQDQAEAHLADLLEETELRGAPLDAVSDAIATWQQDYAEPTVAQVDDDDVAEARSEASLEAGRDLFDQVRRHITELQARLGIEREQAREDLEDATNQVVATLLVAAALLVIAVGALWWLVSRSVERPLDELRADAATVAGGDFDHAIVPVGPPELRELAEAMELMRARIVADLAEAEAARADLEVRRAELDRANTDLGRSNAELEQFAYVASHDLQEPLRKVASFCQLLQNRYGGQLDDRADQYIDFAVDGAKRMQALINDLLAFSRVGRLNTDAVTDVALDDAVGRALENLTMVTEDTGAEIQIPRYSLPVVRGELSLLTQLFQNLIGNSIKFRRPDVTPFIRIQVASTDDEHVITVEDNGIGIDAEYADRIFVIFQRLHSKESYEGTGIGLALCRKIVEHHGGRIEVVTDDARDDPGTTFRITLPTSERSPL